MTPVLGALNKQGTVGFRKGIAANCFNIRLTICQSATEELRNAIKSIHMKITSVCTIGINAGSQIPELLLWRSLTHYQTTNFRLFQTERVCRGQFQIWGKWQTVIQMGRKLCGKRRNCSLRAISPFSTVFSKGLFPRSVKRCRCVGMG